MISAVSGILAIIIMAYMSNQEHSESGERLTWGMASIFLLAVVLVPGLGYALLVVTIAGLGYEALPYKTQKKIQDLFDRKF